MLTIELTPDEAKAALTLLDVAVKSIGLRSAAVALTLAGKIEEKLAELSNTSKTGGAQ